MANVTLGPQNTIFLAAGVATRLLPANGATSGLHTVNVLNLGAGNVWLRSDTDSAVSDPGSEKLPANGVDNGLAFVNYLAAIAETDCTIVIRSIS